MICRMFVAWRAGRGGKMGEEGDLYFLALGLVFVWRYFVPLLYQFVILARTDLVARYLPLHRWDVICIRTVSWASLS